MKKLMDDIRGYMKKILHYIDRYRKPMLVILGSGCIIVFVMMHLYGYRYVRPSEAVVFDAEYVNMFASWTIPTVLSIVAICISVETSRQQNKIALFEKRYEVFETINKLYEMADILVGKTMHYYEMKNHQSQCFFEFKEAYTNFNKIKVKYLFDIEVFTEYEKLNAAFEQINNIEINKTGRATPTSLIANDIRYDKAVKIFRQYNFEILEQKSEKFLTA